MRRKRLAAAASRRRRRPVGRSLQGRGPRRRMSTRCARWSERCGYEMTRQAALLRRWVGGPGDAPLARGHRYDDRRTGQVGRRGTTGTSPSRTSCRSPRPGNASRLRATLPEAPLRGVGGCRRTGASPTSDAMSSTPGRWRSSRRPSLPGPRPPVHASGGPGDLARRANAEGVELDACGSHRRRSRRSRPGRRGRLNDAMARQVLGASRRRGRAIGGCGLARAAAGR